MKPIKATSSSTIEDESLSDVTTNSDEKTIPFLRRLTDMLMENQEVISFEPGHQGKNGDVVLGKILVHDRVKVESTILPKYFNHSSFASLRRQLNYFSFSRVGKGRQRGATYCNEGVIVLNDILRLKRRSIVSPPTTYAGTTTTFAPRGEIYSALPAVSKNKKTALLGSENRCTSLTKRSSRKDLDVVASCSKKLPIKRHRIALSEEGYQTKSPMGTSLAPLPSRVSPVDHVIDTEHNPRTKRISLDLTESAESSLSFPVALMSSAGPPSTIYTNTIGDNDILAACKTLLCFSRGGVPSR